MIIIWSRVNIKDVLGVLHFQWLPEDETGKNLPGKGQLQIPGPHRKRYSPLFTPPHIFKSYLPVNIKGSYFRTI